MTNFSQVVAYKTMNLLNERKALLYPEGMAFYLWERDDRLVIIFDTDEINLGRVDGEFAHLLSTRLNGRRVVRTNSRGVYLQVGREIPPAPMDLVSIPLDLASQPTPTSIPIGMTGRGAFWLDLLEADSILLGGSRGMGKSTMLHGWIQCLLHGGLVEVRAFDGKAASGFGRYADRKNFVMLGNLETSLRDLLMEARRRRNLLKESGYDNAKDYSENVEPMNPIALVIDEAALVPDSSKMLLKEIVERCRDTGVHPIYGTNNPQQSQLVVKSNLVTRFSLAVPNLSASVMVLGHSGAENLPRVKGRGLVEWNGRMVEFQAFQITKPMPSEEARKAIQELPVEDAEQPAQADDNETRILALHEQGKSMSAIVREVWGVAGGSAYYGRAETVKAILAAKNTTSSTSTPISSPVFGLTGA